MWDAQEIIKWLEGTGTCLENISRFEQDSRLVIPGTLFFALQGERVDGHSFLDEVAKKGAAAAVVDMGYQGSHAHLPLIRVDNVLMALHRLARTIQAKRNAKVIAVTGSAGKTTTKEFIATLLESKFRVGKTPGNANSQVGLPLSLLNARGDEEVFVIEMGMSQKHEIETLVSIAPPDIAIVTCVSLAHAAFFPDGMEGIAEAKAEIFSHSNTRLGIVQAKAARFSSLMGKGSCQKITYGWDEQAEMRIEKIKDLFQITGKEGKSPTFALPFEASHLVENAVGSAIAALAMGMSWEEILLQAQQLTLYQQRFEKVERDGVIFINDAYNANPASMIAALQNLPRPAPSGKTIAVLGAMKELGSFCEASHLDVAAEALKRVDHLLCLGEECAPMVSFFHENGLSAELFEQLGDIKRRTFELAQPGDVVLLKGSNSKRLWQVLEVEKV